MSDIHAHLYQQHAITPDELDVLREDEPGISFKPITVEGVSQGRQSRVTVLEYTLDADTHYKVMWKRMGADKGLLPEEAESMRLRLVPYKRSLEAVGWKVPKLFYTRPVKIRNEVQIFSYEEFIEGGDGEAMISDPAVPNFRKWHLVQRTLEFLFNYPPDKVERRTVLGRELTLLPHGLDLKAANIVLRASTDELYFVDLFGPKELDAHGQWRNYSSKLDSLPKENLLAVCATREGNILRFWRLARRMWEPCRSRRLSLTQEFLERLGELNPPENELEFIRQELNNGYEWFNALYAERRI